MIIDRYTKFVFTLIAISLFLIALNPWIAPTKAYAELNEGDLSGIESNLSGINSTLRKISRGMCLNSKIC